MDADALHTSRLEEGAVPELPADAGPQPSSDATRLPSEASGDPSAISAAPPLEIGVSSESESPRAIPAVPPAVDVRELDWCAVRRAVDPEAVRTRINATVQRLEALLDRAEGPGLLFDDQRTGADLTVLVSTIDSEYPLWVVGDLHGDLLALEASLALMTNSAADGASPPRIIFLGDLFDDAGFGLETLLRVFELIVASPRSVCVIAGNHDEALAYDGTRFSSTVAPSDFADFLNENLADEPTVRAGKLAIRLFARAPRALFFPDGLLVTHGGFPLVDLHPRLAETGDWNDPACLDDFVWTRAHPKARKKLPNRHSRGSQYGYEDFAAFCSLAAALGRPVTHMVRGHDHVEDRYAVYPAYAAHPVLTTVALSRRLPRESFGPYARVPTVARYLPGALPQVYRLHVPADLVQEVYPEPREQTDHAPVSCESDV